jgi:hypothetical protein
MYLNRGLISESEVPIRDELEIQTMEQQRQNREVDKALVDSAIISSTGDGIAPGKR